MRVLSPLEVLLAREVDAIGVTYAASPIADSPPSISVAAYWDAFRAFAAAPVDDLIPGLKMPRDGADIDTLVYEPSPAQAAVPNIPARPPVLTLARRVYLVNADDEFQEQATAALNFELSGDLASVVAAERALYGHGGPRGDEGPNVPVGQDNWFGQAGWFRAIEQSAFGTCLRSPEVVARVTSW